MKKWLAVGLVLLVGSLGASIAFAQDQDTSATANNNGTAIQQMADFCRQAGEQAVQNGKLTPAQGNAMQDHMKQMAPGMQQGVGSAGAGQGMPCHGSVTDK